MTVPMTIIGGFLGSGKTTLLNRVLSGSAGVRYGVLVNDFGDLALDGALVTRHGGDTMTFANGCVCCSLSDGLLEGIDRLMATSTPPEQFLVEASGVADPGTLADYATLHPQLHRDLVIVLADITTVRERANDERLQDTVERQLSCADLIVANRCDLVVDEQRASITGWLSEQTNGTVFETTFAKVPMDVLAASPRVTSAGGPPATAAHQHLHAHSLGAHHTSIFRTETLPLATTLSVQKLEAGLLALAPSVLRAKGLVRTDEGQTWEVQIAGGRVSSAQCGPVDSERMEFANKLVVIGFNDLPTADTLLRAFTEAPPA